MCTGVLLMYWFLVLVLNGGNLLGGGYGGQGGILFFEGAFGGYLFSISHIKYTNPQHHWGKRSAIILYFIFIG